MNSPDPDLARERHARRNAEQVASDALAKRDQAERDRDAACAERDALQIEIAALRSALNEILAKIPKAAAPGRN